MFLWSPANLRRTPAPIPPRPKLIQPGPKLIQRCLMQLPKHLLGLLGLIDHCQGQEGIAQGQCTRALKTV